MGVMLFSVWSRRRVFAAEWESDFGFGIVLSSSMVLGIIVHLHKMRSDIRPMNGRLGVGVGVPTSDVLVQSVMAWFAVLTRFGSIIGELLTYGLALNYADEFAMYRLYMFIVPTKLNCKAFL